MNLNSELTDEHLLNAICRILQISVCRCNPDGVPMPDVEDLFRANQGKYSHI